MNIELLYEVKVDDKIVIKQRPAESFLLQFLQLLDGAMRHAYNTTMGAYQNITDTAGVTKLFGAKAAGVNVAQYFAALSPAGNLTYGIVVGSGNTAPTNTDITMDTVITEGAGAGQLNYQATAFVIAQVVGANVDFILQRAAINNSGGDVTVRESGIRVFSLDSEAGPNTHSLQIIRDVFGDVVVGNLQTITVTYTLMTTV